MPCALLVGYRWVLLKEGQEPAREVGRVGVDRAEAPPAAAPSGGGEPGYLAAAGIEGGLGRGPEVDRLRDMLRHRDDQLASLQDQLRQLESTRDRHDQPPPPAPPGVPSLYAGCRCYLCVMSTSTQRRPKLLPSLGGRNEARCPVCCDF